MYKFWKIFNQNSFGVLIYIKSISENLTVCSKSLALFYIGHHLFWLLEKNKKFLLHPNVHDSFSQHICMYICVCFTLLCILLKGHRNSLAFFVSYPCCIFYEISWLWNRLFTVSKVLVSLASIHSHLYILTSWCDFGGFCMLTLLQATKLFVSVP